MSYVPSRKACQTLGITANTLRTWDEKNIIETIKTPSNQRLYNIESFISQKLNKTEKKFKKDIIYTRVSSQSQNKT